MEERLQKLISRAGVASRRHAEELIVSGQVTVNGQVVTELGSKADAERDHVKVGGKLLRFPEAKTYLVLHKPVQCVSTMHDPEGRKALGGLVAGVPGRVFPVGRLDYNAEGLLLLTNDGELANRLMKVSSRLPQTFWIKVKGPLTDVVMREVRQYSGARFEPLRGRKNAPNPWYEVTLTEASRDALRQNLARLGHPVEKLRRVRLGPLELGDVAPGRYRALASGEVAALERMVARVLRGEAPAPAARPERNGAWKKFRYDRKERQRQGRRDPTKRKHAG